MHRDRYLEHVARDGRRMAELARGDLDAPVPTCPDWTLRDLLTHTGAVQRWLAEGGRTDTGSLPDLALLAQKPADDGSMASWLVEGVERAVDVLSGVDGTAARTTWFPPDQTAQWYFRRIAQETLVHRLDAELAAGDVTDVDAAFAVDGIDEMCDVFIPSATGQPINGGGETLHLHATDAEGEWLLTLHADRVDVARGHAKGDAAIRGAARDLLLLVWGREPLGDIETFGDESVVATFRAAAKIQ